MTWRKDLENYLRGHELDIATDFEDFGSLIEVFHHFMKRPARSDTKK